MCASSAICWSARLEWYTRPQGVIPFRPRGLYQRGLYPLYPSGLSVAYTSASLNPIQPTASLSVDCLYVCALAPLLIAFNIELPPWFSMHRTQDYNSILLDSKRSLFSWRSGVRNIQLGSKSICFGRVQWSIQVDIKCILNKCIFCWSWVSDAPLNLLIADMPHAHNHHKSREIHIFEKVENAATREKKLHV